VVETKPVEEKDKIAIGGESPPAPNVEEKEVSDAEIPKLVPEVAAPTPEIVVDTEQPHVHFSEFNTVFKDGESEIVPTATGDEDDEDSELPLKIYEQTESLSFDDFEQVDSRPASPMEFEVLN
jgi:hypothetical protein